MTKEEKERIKQDVRRMIPDLARKNHVLNYEVELILKEMFQS